VFVMNSQFAEVLEVTAVYVELQWRTLLGKCVMYGAKCSHGVPYDATVQLLHVIYM
jgi:hypothetical protein